MSHEPIKPFTVVEHLAGQNAALRREIDVLTAELAMQRAVIARADAKLARIDHWAGAAKIVLPT